MNKLSLLGSCQQVVMINYSAIKSDVKKQNLRIISKYSQKNHSTANRSIYTCPIFPKKRFHVFSTILSRRRSVWAQFVFDAPSFHNIYLRILRRHVIIIEDSP